MMNVEQDLKYTIELIEERAAFFAAFIKLHQNNPSRRTPFDNALKNWMYLMDSLKEARDVLAFNLGDNRLVHDNLVSARLRTTDELAASLSAQINQLYGDLERLNRGSRQKTVMDRNGISRIEIEKNHDAIATVQKTMENANDKLSTVQKSNEEIYNLLTKLTQYQRPDYLE